MYVVTEREAHASQASLRAYPAAASQTSLRHFNDQSTFSWGLVSCPYSSEPLDLCAARTAPPNPCRLGTLGHPFQRSDLCRATALKAPALEPRAQPIPGQLTCFSSPCIGPRSDFPRRLGLPAGPSEERWSKTLTDDKVLETLLTCYSDRAGSETEVGLCQVVGEQPSGVRPEPPTTGLVLSLLPSLGRKGGRERCSTRVRVAFVGKECCMLLEW